MVVDDFEIAGREVDIDCPHLALVHGQLTRDRERRPVLVAELKLLDLYGVRRQLDPGIEAGIGTPAERHDKRTVPDVHVSLHVRVGARASHSHIGLHRPGDVDHGRCETLNETETEVGRFDAQVDLICGCCGHVPGVTALEERERHRAHGRERLGR